MADNKENGRADLFEILNELHQDDGNEKGNPASGNATQSPEEGTRFESEAHVEELLKILSSKDTSEEGVAPAPTVDEAEKGEQEAAPEMKSRFGEEFSSIEFSNVAEEEQPPQGDIDSPTQEESEAEEEEEPEIPTALFGHLSNEASIVSDSGNPHFTDEVTPAPPLPVEEEALEDEEDEEEDSKVKKVGRFFRGMSFIPKAVIYFVLVLVVSAYLAYYIITIGNDVFALVSDSREVTIVIEEGYDDDDVAKLLKEKGVIKYSWVYKLYMKYRGDGDSEDSYIVGEHTLNQNFNYSQIITALTNDRVEREIKRLTIPEGYTVEQIIALLVDNGIGERDDYIEAINNYPYKWDFVQQLDALLATKPNSGDRIYRLEGYLYPDTYEFSTTEDEVFVINKMLGAFNDKFWREFVRVDDKGNSLQKQALEEFNMTFDDIIILASIIQSEGGNSQEFYYVSYVFHNRLKNPNHDGINGYLESDATIQYVLPERVDAAVVPVELETPYNTYKYKALPPGAISNPGTDALSAVFNPEKPRVWYGKDEDDYYDVDAYYFVTNKAGKTYWAKYNSEHVTNSAQVKKDNAEIEAGTYEG